MPLQTSVPIACYVMVSSVRTNTEEVQKSRGNSSVTKRSDVETGHVLMVPLAGPEVIDLAPIRSSGISRMGFPNNKQP